MCRYLQDAAIARLGAIVAIAAATALPHRDALATLRVAPTGLATYAVPFAVTPPAGAPQPVVTLTYSSQSTSGLLGIGWSVEGLSVISRCPRTPAADGVRGTVSHDWNDRYCLDGQRLALLSRAYGDHGAEYRVDGDSGLQIRSFGQHGNGPAYFLVKTKSGLDLYFGASDEQVPVGPGKLRADGALVIPRGAPNAGTVVSWHLALVRDRLGNSMAYQYETEVSGDPGSPSVEHRLKRIHYTLNGASAAPTFAFVEFEYQASPVLADVLRAFAGGVAFQSTRRLVAVRSMLRPAGGKGESLVRKYVFAYDSKGAQGRSRLVGMHECTTDCAYPGRSVTTSTDVRAAATT